MSKLASKNDHAFLWYFYLWFILSASVLALAQKLTYYGDYNSLDFLKKKSSCEFIDHCDFFYILLTLRCISILVYLNLTEFYFLTHQKKKPVTFVRFASSVLFNTCSV